MYRPRRRNVWSAGAGVGSGAGVEITPLIDVVFLLLTFFVFALILTVRVEVTSVTLPTVAEGEAETLAEPPVVIALDASGEVDVGGAAVGEAGDAGLAAVLREVIAEQGLGGRIAQSGVVVAIDEGASSGELLWLLDALAALGHDRVRFWRRPNVQTGAAASGAGS
jgi:biopolymer transport protein ExbD